MEVTREQFQEYLRVQTEGRYNMLSPEAIPATGLSREVYINILSQYDELTVLYGEGEIE